MLINAEMLTVTDTDFNMGTEEAKRNKGGAACNNNKVGTRFEGKR